jgi:hypothetical protein
MRVESRRLVTYLSLADNVLRPLASRLSAANQPVIRSHMRFAQFIVICSKPKFVPIARGGREEVCVFARDGHGNLEESRHSSARFYTLQAAII